MDPSDEAIDGNTTGLWYLVEYVVKLVRGFGEPRPGLLYHLYTVSDRVPSMVGSSF